MDVGLVDLGVAEDLLDGLEGAAEEVLAQLLETSTGEGGVEVDTLEEGVNFDGGLSSRRESALSTLARGAKTTQSTGVGREIYISQKQSVYISSDLDTNK